MSRPGVYHFSCGMQIADGQGRFEIVVKKEGTNNEVRDRLESSTSLEKGN